jgi:hypothetical protein
VTSAFVAGALAGKPGNGGEAWVRLSWALGLRDLGIDAWLVEEVAAASLEALAWFASVTEGFGLEDRCALVDSGGEVLHGPDLAELTDAAEGADLLVNISGNLKLEPLASAPARRVYLDLDPGYTQLWYADGHLGPIESQHDSFYTVGTAIGRGDCPLPTHGIEWRATLPPILLSEWPATASAEPGPEPVTTVGSWRGGYGRVEHDGRLYGQKAHEFRRLAGLPHRVGLTCEAALAFEPEDHADADALRSGGWRLVDPRAVAGDPSAYREYLARSGAELSPAQGIYVETRCGWFSDRSAAYLASGRPAVVQDTGSTGVPVGEGLLTFRGPDEAVDALDRLAAAYEDHALAARTLAEDHFDSRVVLSKLLEEVIR